VKVDNDLRKLRRLILESASVSKEGHIPSALSILDILYLIYSEFIPIGKNNPIDAIGNRFILSKGHASLGLYAVLSHIGLFSESELTSFAKYDSILGGHPDRNKVPGVELSTGSLGHGLPQALGIATALKIKRLSGHVYVLIGDGEANEGTIWESALLAPNHKLGNLTCIVDNNLSSERALDMGNIANKFAAFGWETVEINGHDHDEIRRALRLRNNSKPIVVIANTVKGFGVPTMESNPEWHHRSPNSDELTFLLGELG
jgi:transketolase